MLSLSSAGALRKSACQRRYAIASKHGLNLMVSHKLPVTENRSGESRPTYVSMTKTQHDERGCAHSPLRFTISIAFSLLVNATCSSIAFAYIGPGAGFVFVGSFLIVLITSLLVLVSLVTWPVRCTARAIRRRKTVGRSAIRRAIILGLDGLDPALTERLMNEGKLPHMARLRDRGTFSRLGTTYPAISPVAWSSFQTGVNPGKHNIFDFLSRDTMTYQPRLSSVEMRNVERRLNIGHYSIPVGKPSIRALRKSRPFWHALGEHGISSCILRVPVTFPPEKSRGRLLSGMCVPDLLGTQGTFTLYTTRDDIRCEHGTGAVVHVELAGNAVQTNLTGPENFLKKARTVLTIPIKMTVHRENESVEVRVSGQRFTLSKGNYSDWVTVQFNAGFGMNITGICRFLLVEAGQNLSVYVTPIHIDPERPALPIAHPFVYSSYLSKLLGRFPTLGLAEDTWALSEGVIGEDAFLDQCYMFHDERERVFFNALSRTREDVCVSVFDAPDRVQHMFWRYLDKTHPANRGRNTDNHAGAIEEIYCRMDKLLGRTIEQLDERDLLIVMSDHGFESFSRGVNINSWLHENDYLALQDGTESGEWFSAVDWSHTRAYAIGLAGIYLNMEGRESRGIVHSGDEAQTLKVELIARLSGLKDPERGGTAITDVWDTAAIYSGPYVDNAPDLIVGYAPGYRASWGSVTGKVNTRVFEDNIMKWSGDHCMDPRSVPGILLSNRRMALADRPNIMDIAPTVLAAFGIERPSYMDGVPIRFE